MSRNIRRLARLASLLALVVGAVEATPSALAAGIPIPPMRSPGTRTPPTSSNDWIGLVLVGAVVLAIALIAFAVNYLQHGREASSAEAEIRELVEVGGGR
jgi:hypothetical protein